MNSLSPQEFYRMFSGASTLSVVGNSDSLLQWENGERIDASDMVVRFNRARVEGLEKHVGSRTDLLVVNQINNLERSPHPAGMLNPKAALLLAFLDESSWLGRDSFSDWLGDIPVFSTIPPDIVGMAHELHHRGYSSGTYALYLLTTMFSFERIFITGFNFFGLTSGSSGHYFSGKDFAMGWHEVLPEIRVFSQLLSRFSGELEMTEEVAEVLAQSQVSAEIATRKLPISEFLARQLFRAAYLVRNARLRR